MLVGLHGFHLTEFEFPLAFRLRAEEAFRRALHARRTRLKIMLKVQETRAAIAVAEVNQCSLSLYSSFL